MMQIFVFLITTLLFSGVAHAEWELVDRKFEKDGTPTFIFGVMNDTRPLTSSDFQLMKEIGFDTIVTFDAVADGTGDADDYASYATTNDIVLIVSLSDFARGFESDLLPDWLSGDDLTESQEVLVANGAWATKKFTWCLYGETWLGWTQALHDLTDDQKTQLAEEYYAKNESNWTGIINSSIATDNLMGFYLIDEPKTLVAQRLGELMSNLVHTLAPNASVFNMYTPGDLNDFDPPYILEPEWIAWGDAIGVDAYVNPAEPNTPVRSTVDFVTNNVGWQERRLETGDKVNWVVLATDANTSESITWGAEYTKELQFAQTYLAIIQGAKAIVYYRYEFLDVEETTPWFEELSTRIAKLGPIAMQPDIVQTVTYDQPFELGVRYTSGVFPDVLVKLMTDPDGEYVLLVTNAETRDVTVNITMDLFEDGATVGRLFDAGTITISGNTLTETLEAHGTRAYTFTSSVTQAANTAIDVTRSSGHRFAGSFSGIIQ